MATKIFYTTKRLLACLFLFASLGSGACCASPPTPIPWQTAPDAAVESLQPDSATKADTPKPAPSKENPDTAKTTENNDGQAATNAVAPKPAMAVTTPKPASQAETKVTKSALEKRLRTLAATYPDLEVGISVYDITTEAYAEIRGDRSFPMASAFKLPVMVETARQLQEGLRGLTLDSPITITNATKCIGNGDLAYSRTGSTIPLREAIEKMITVSDNTATDSILAEIGIRNVNRLLINLGMSHSSVFLSNRQAWLLSLRQSVPHNESVESFVAYWNSLNFAQKCQLANQVAAEHTNTSLDQIQAWENASAKNETFAQSSTMAAAVDNYGSPNDYNRLLVKLWKGKILNKQWTDYCLGVLSRQQYNNRIPALLPAGTKVYHKTGTICGVVNDTGIMMVGNHPVAISVFIDKVKPERVQTASKAGAEFARTVYDFIAAPPADAS